MRTILLLCLLAAGPSAYAQSAGANADSSSASQSAAGANSNNANNVTIASSAPETQTVRYTGGQHIKSNTPVGLAASVSFSSDYCGGTASGGASAAGITIGASKPIMDENCQALRRAEKIGMAAVTAANLGNAEASEKLHRLAVWQLCVIDQTMQDACHYIGLVGDGTMPRTDDTLPVQ